MGKVQEDGAQALDPGPWHVLSCPQVGTGQSQPPTDSILLLLAYPQVSPRISMVSDNSVSPSLSSPGVTISPFKVSAKEVPFAGNRLEKGAPGPWPLIPPTPSSLHYNFRKTPNWVTCEIPGALGGFPSVTQSTFLH